MTMAASQDIILEEVEKVCAKGGGAGESSALISPAKAAAAGADVGDSAAPAASSSEAAAPRVAPASSAVSDEHPALREEKASTGAEEAAHDTPQKEQKGGAGSAGPGSVADAHEDQTEAGETSNSGSASRRTRRGTNKRGKSKNVAAPARRPPVSDLRRALRTQGASVIATMGPGGVHNPGHPAAEGPYPGAAVAGLGQAPPGASLRMPYQPREQLPPYAVPHAAYHHQAAAAAAAAAAVAEMPPGMHVHPTPLPGYRGPQAPHAMYPPVSPAATALDYAYAAEVYGTRRPKPPSPAAAAFDPDMYYAAFEQGRAFEARRTYAEDRWYPTEEKDHSTGSARQWLAPREGAASQAEDKDSSKQPTSSSAAGTGGAATLLKDAPALPSSFDPHLPVKMRIRKSLTEETAWGWAGMESVDVKHMKV